MFGHSYYHGVIRKYIALFGTMFNDIDVYRLDKNGNRIQTIRVPIAYGPKEKFLVRLEQDPNLDNEVAITLPRMGFEITGMEYDSSRKLPSTLTHFKQINASSKDYQFTPVPYNIQISLHVFVKNADDGVQILEQIFPFFTPEWTAQLKLIPELDIVYDIPTVLNGISTEDTYEGDYASRRALIHTLDFTVRGFIFGPINNKGVIKRSIVNTYADVEETTPKSSTTIAEDDGSGGSIEDTEFFGG